MCQHQYAAIVDIKEMLLFKIIKLYSSTWLFAVQSFGCIYKTKHLCPCYNCYTHMLCTCKCLYGCYGSHGNSEGINNVQQKFCDVYLFAIMHVASIANGDGDMHLLIFLIGLNINNTCHNILDDSPQA